MDFAPRPPHSEVRAAVIAMDALPIRRPPSPVEAAGLWAALTLALALVMAMSHFSLPALFAVPPDPRAWQEAHGEWLRALVGTAPIVSVMALAPRWLPDRRARRWPLLVPTVLGATALGWWAQSHWLDLWERAPGSAAEARAMQHTLFVAALLIAVVSEYRHGFLRAAELLHEAEIARLRLQGELAAGRLQLLQAQIAPRTRRATRLRMRSHLRIRAC